MASCIMLANENAGLNPEAHPRAKRTVSALKTSVFGLIESLLQSVAVVETPSIVDRMIGATVLRDAGDAPDSRMDALRAKYLKA